MGGNGMEDILMLYYEINNIYLELYKMELSYDKDNSMFIELINLLNEKILEEKELFGELCSCIDDEENDILCRLDEVVDNPFTKRIVDYMRFYNDNGDYAKLYVACTRNVYLIYLSFLQEYIDNREYESLRKGILSYKYYNSFICHDVEYSNIVNKFSIDVDNYINLDTYETAREYGDDQGIMGARVDFTTDSDYRYRTIDVKASHTAEAENGEFWSGSTDESYIQ